MDAIFLLCRSLKRP